jgi:hypothetical protein
MRSLQIFGSKTEMQLVKPPWAAAQRSVGISGLYLYGTCTERWTRSVRVSGARLCNADAQCERHCRQLCLFQSLCLRRQRYKRARSLFKSCHSFLTRASCPRPLMSPSKLLRANEHMCHIPASALRPRRALHAPAFAAIHSNAMHGEVSV